MESAQAGRCVPDVLVTLPPIRVLCTLNLAREKKTGLTGSFALALFTMLCSIRVQADQTHPIRDENSSLLIVWGIIEFHVGTMVPPLLLLAPACLGSCNASGAKRGGDESGRRRGEKGHDGQNARNPRNANDHGHFHLRTCTPTEMSSQSLASVDTDPVADRADVAINDKVDLRPGDWSGGGAKSPTVFTSLDPHQAIPGDPCQAVSDDSTNPFDDVFAVFD
ncbi:hypothetical protein BBAD15_g12518 [Beauveria bassiana D1-5]|uniref:Rhodopsin domain-containing protein n=1 Tax=Beauveria bassiana D1-5 TaxID=1245745 RepID=A0A0A2V481_BEABA|nr:hypothetical protein BBAD15_g12518 [Beauveria bassiana D1-5]